MPKQRTRKQKTRAQYHYAFPANRSFSGLESAKTAEPQAKNPSTKTDVSSLYYYDPGYITKDLRKTLLVSVIILGVQLGIYFWLR